MKGLLAVTLTAVLCLSMFSVLALKVSAQQSSSGNWPMFRADPSHTGDTAGSTVVTPNLLWSYPIQSEPGGGISSPAVVNGVLYVGSPDGNLYALNATDGVKLWNYSTGAAIDSSPAVDDGIVYVGSLGFYALNATNGDKIWSFMNSGYVSYSPTVVDGVVYFGAGNIVYALNAKSGLVFWDKTVSSSWWAIYSSPAVVDGVVYIGSDDYDLYA